MLCALVTILPNTP